jgi:hypothetical protein
MAGEKDFVECDCSNTMILSKPYCEPKRISAPTDCARPLLKKYYVTEALRLIATTDDKVIFKGGTGLSKGWNLLQRFSEDIDIFLNPVAFEPALGTNAINRELKRLRDKIAAHPALTLLPEESQTIGGFGRNDHFAYNRRFGGVGEIANRVFLEAGTASGNQPIETRHLSSFLAQFLQESGKSLGAENEITFPMRLPHFRRTFVEKLFAIHGKVELLKRDNKPIGSYARHCYDLYQLAKTPDIPALLQSAEYSEIKSDYDRISTAHFSRDYHAPEGFSFANSDALFPRNKLRAMLGAEYESQCKLLCFRAYPSWEEVLIEFEVLRSLL